MFPKPAHFLFLLLLLPRKSSSQRADFEWTSPRSTTEPYLVTSEVTGTETSLSRCTKVTGATAPEGYGPDFRSVNMDNELFWQTTRGPRSSYASTFDNAQEALWSYLGGSAQLFVHFQSNTGVDVSHFGSLRCIAWTNNSLVSESGKDWMATGVEIAPNTSNALLAYNMKLPELHNLPVTPVLLGMTPGVYLNSVPGKWERRNDLLENIVNIPSSTEAYLRIFERLSTSVNVSDIDRDQWFSFHPTRAYNESQCGAWLDENDRLERGDTEPQEVYGILEGDSNCDYNKFTTSYLQNIATEIVTSGNSVDQPLTVLQGLFLVVVPALWEAVISSILLYVRLSKKKHSPRGMFSTTKWLFFELATLSVALAEFGILIGSTIRQSRWQPCHIGRFFGGDANESPDPLAFTGSASNVVKVAADVLSMECFENPGTDLVWAVVIGSVVIIHSVVLGFEAIYVWSPPLRRGVDRSVDNSRFPFCFRTRVTADSDAETASGGDDRAAQPNSGADVPV